MTHFECLPGRGPRLMSRLSRQSFGISRLSRPKLGFKWHFQFFATPRIIRDFGDQNGDGAIEIPRLIFGVFRLSRPRFVISSFSRSNYSVSSLSIEMETARPAQLRQRGDQFQPFPFQTILTDVVTARVSRPTWRRRNQEKISHGFCN